MPEKSNYLRAVCRNCRWRGRSRKTKAEAEIDAAKHQQEHSDHVVDVEYTQYG